MKELRFSCSGLDCKGTIGRWCKNKDPHAGRLFIPEAFLTENEFLKEDAELTEAFLTVANNVMRIPRCLTERPLLFGDCQQIEGLKVIAEDANLILESLVEEGNFPGWEFFNNEEEQD
jgi:hypothetical protein